MYEIGPPILLLLTNINGMGCFILCAKLVGHSSKLCLGFLLINAHILVTFNEACIFE